ncbi:hypothetical protein RvY_08440 [Ramazzottius varieornatus]|uniref:Uncharacterized protein n=1 Tax=Ramazzottius varieornatus TaxID=947166 RepID=A0A1D1V8H7_RAMVA|nr:hypothetical protein RvY_08440 [Ramazzottius varieornatus]
MGMLSKLDKTLDMEIRQIAVGQLYGTIGLDKLNTNCAGLSSFYNMPSACSETPPLLLQEYRNSGLPASVLPLTLVF